MRILVLSGLYPPYYKGGHEIATKTIADGLRDKGHEVRILTSRYGVSGLMPEESGVYRTPGHIETKASGLEKRYLQLKTAIVGRLNYGLTRTVLRKVQADVVYSGQLENVTIFPVKAVQDHNVPIIHHVGQYDFTRMSEIHESETNPLKRFYRSVITGFRGLGEFDFRHLVTLSEAVKRTYVAAGIAEGNISVIPPLGIPEAMVATKTALRIPSMQKGVLRLLYVGRIVPEKGIHVAIRALFNILNDHDNLDISLDIIGDGDPAYEASLKELSRTLGIGSLVTFRNRMNRQEVLSSYSSYDVLLVPSIWDEPFGIIILEAMSQGVPVVATSVGGIPEIIRDRESGMLVPPDDPDRMALAITELCEDSGLAGTIVTGGIDTVLQRYTYGGIIDRVEAYLDNVAKERGIVA